MYLVQLSIMPVFTLGDLSFGDSKGSCEAWAMWSPLFGGDCSHLGARFTAPPQPVNQRTRVPLQGVERAHMSWHVLLPSHPLPGPPCQALVPAPPPPSPIPPLPVSPVHRRPPSGHSLQNKGSSLAPSATLRATWLDV